MRTPTAFIASLALCSIATAQNVGAGAGTAESREAIHNTGDAPPPKPDSGGAQQPAAGPPADAPRFKIAGGFVQQFNTSLNSGGNYAASRAYGAFSSRTRILENMNLDIGIGYEFDHYELHGTTLGLGSTLNTEALSVTPRFTVALDEHWAVGGAPILQMAGESQADAGKTITGGALANFRYAFDQDHVLGLGILGKGLLGSGVIVVPAPLVDWKIGESTRISNIRGPEANPFVGLEIEHELGPSLDVGFGGAWEFRQARLDDSGADANFIFQESNTSIYGRIEWRPVNNLRLDLVAGSALYSRVKTLDGGGDTVTSTGANPALILGAFVSFRF
jgi:hypothetical protein